MANGGVNWNKTHGNGFQHVPTTEMKGRMRTFNEKLAFPDAGHAAADQLPIGAETIPRSGRIAQILTKGDTTNSLTSTTATLYWDNVDDPATPTSITALAAMNTSTESFYNYFDDLYTVPANSSGQLLIVMGSNEPADALATWQMNILYVVD